MRKCKRVKVTKVKTSKPLNDEIRKIKNSRQLHAPRTSLALRNSCRRYMHSLQVHKNISVNVVEANPSVELSPPKKPRKKGTKGND